MTSSEFIKVKLSGHKPQFKNLVSLTESGKTGTILDFCTRMHPNTTKMAQDSKCNVYTPKKHYIYTIYTKFILRTDVQTGNKILYNL